jgi:hypothetical protein
MSRRIARRLGKGQICYRAPLSLQWLTRLNSPDLLHPGGELDPPELFAPRRILFERLPVGGIDGALGRENAGCRAARYASGADELGDRRLAIRLRHGVAQHIVNHWKPPLLFSLAR